MNRYKLTLDWLVYLILIVIVSVLFTFGLVYTTEMIGTNSQPSIKLVLLLTYGLSRIFITPIFVSIFAFGRFMDIRIRNKTIFFN